MNSTWTWPTDPLELAEISDKLTGSELRGQFGTDRIGVRARVMTRWDTESGRVVWTTNEEGCGGAPGGV